MLKSALFWKVMTLLGCPPIRSSYAQTIGQDRLPGWGQSILTS